MDIKWTAAPGPAPLPLSKRAREAMGVSDDDKPWAHPDPPSAASSLGLGDPLLLCLILLCVGVITWAYRRFVGYATPGESGVTTKKPSQNTPVTDEMTRLAREARLKRFETQQASFAEIMQQASRDTPTGPT